VALLGLVKVGRSRTDPLQAGGWPGLAEFVRSQVAAVCPDSRRVLAREPPDLAGPEFLPQGSRRGLQFRARTAALGWPPERVQGWAVDLGVRVRRAAVQECLLQKRGYPRLVSGGLRRLRVFLVRPPV
jgi:hypothetical protein